MMKRFIIGVVVLLSVLGSNVSYAKKVEDDRVWNRIKSNIDHYDIMIRPTIKKFGDFTRATTDIKLQSSALDAIKPVKNFQNICSHIAYILGTKEFIDSSKLDEYYNYIFSILPYICQDLRIEYEDLDRKSLLVKNKALINIVRKAQHTMLETLNDIKIWSEFKKN